MDNQEIIVIFWNARFLYNNLHRFEELITKNNYPHIICIQEVFSMSIKYNIKEKITELQQKIEKYGYKMFMDENANKPNVAFIIKNTIVENFTIIDNVEFPEDKHELLKNRVLIGNINNLRIINIYAPRLVYNPEFFEALLYYITNFTHIYGKSFIIGGDFNTTIHKYEHKYDDYAQKCIKLKLLLHLFKLCDIYYKDYIDKTICEENSEEYEKYYTHHICRIDYILINDRTNYIDCGMLERYGSDHKAIWIKMII